MKTASDAVVFDASAVLAYLLAEPGSARVKADLRNCQAGRTEGWVSPVTLAEIHRRLLRSLPAPEAARAIDHLLLTPIAVAPLDRSVALLSAEWSVAAGVGLLDSIVAATAAHLHGHVLTADPDFGRFGSRVRVTFIR
ncbi:MAG: PIN domain-containing protein [Planctomycetes bacterium]|nr:PIN domain-containing protein [Planctomycetota bacterium]